MVASSFSLDLRLKDYFFDKDLVQAKLTASEAKAMSRIGAFIRTNAMRRLRRRKKASSPGSPPSVHSQDKFASLKNILFGYDPKRHTVVTGPVKLNQNTQSITGRTTVPELHEFGGVARIYETRFRGTSRRPVSEWFRRDLRKRIPPWMEARVRLAVYPARPFMGPALDQEVAKGTITEAWRATVST